MALLLLQGKLASLLAVNVGMHFLFNVDWETVRD